MIFIKYLSGDGNPKLIKRIQTDDPDFLIPKLGYLVVQPEKITSVLVF